LIPLRDTTPSRRFPIVTISIIVVNLVIFLYELSLGPALDSFINTYGVIPQNYTHHLPANPFRLVTHFLPVFSSMFLHGGWLHVIGNMWYLWIFGDNVEDRLGKFRFIVFYLLCGLAASLAHILINSQSTIPTIGASGAIAGVMGAYFILFPKSKVLTLLPIFFFFYFVEIPAFFFLGIWILIQFLYGAVSVSQAEQAGGVAWWAHFGGFLAGMVLVFVFRKYKY
jgi:membrane associated rhomboid family serine protease